MPVAANLRRIDRHPLKPRQIVRDNRGPARSRSLNSRRSKHVPILPPSEYRTPRMPSPLTISARKQAATPTTSSAALQLARIAATRAGAPTSGGVIVNCRVNHHPRLRIDCRANSAVRGRATRTSYSSCRLSFAYFARDRRAPSEAACPGPAHLRSASAP